MPSNYNFTQNSFTYSFDDIFVFDININNFIAKFKL
jgi:hypothetical protein